MNTKDLQTVTYHFADNTKQMQPVVKQSFFNEKGKTKTMDDMNNLFNQTAADRKAIAFTTNLSDFSNEIVPELQVVHFDKKERKNAKKDYKDFQKLNPGAFKNQLQQFKAMVTDKFANTKMRVRMNVTVIAA